MRERRLVAGLSALTLAVSCTPEPVRGGTALARDRQDARPLTLVLVVDQLPMEILAREGPRFGGRGLGRFLERGLVYRDASYPFASTLTAVAHASIVTGRLPRDHGIVGNEWWDRERGEVVYSASPAAERDGAEAGGVLAPTVGGVLDLAGIESWAVSLKDRAAFFLAGRAGTPLWYDRRSGTFVAGASREPRSAIERLTSRVSAERLLGWTWEPLLPLERYRHACPAGRTDCLPTCETASPFASDGLPLRVADDPAAGFRQLPYTPAGDELTVDVVEALLAGGLVGAPALLGVSLSATDYIGHAFGPDSLEYEDELLRLSETIERLLVLLETHVGADRFYAILTSDHGTAARPGCLAQRGIPAGRLTAAEVETRANAFLSGHDATGAARAVVLVPNLYVAGTHPSRETLHALAAELEALPGLARAIPHDVLAAAEEPAAGAATTQAGRLLETGELLPRAWRSFHPERSGDLVLVQEPHWYFADSGGSVAMHGSPYSYDTHVPLVVLGPGIPARSVERRVSPLAIAATVAGLYGLEPPAGAEPALPEVAAALGVAHGSAPR